MKKRIMLLILVNLIVLASIIFCQSSDLVGQQIPKVIKLDSAGKDYLRVLAGPPESSTMRSGLVLLAPKKSVGKHSTEKYEELVIIIEGKGEMAIIGGSTLLFAKGEVVYCPPNTEHNVTNTGEENLIYLYVVAEAKN
ncbi:MAG: cupin domain-containing protein [Candidatus Aminicenantes bacterium]|nr:cupin domain-containing protein [Candidatus Aminicenantes bacterium]